MVKQRLSVSSIIIILIAAFNNCSDVSFSNASEPAGDADKTDCKRTNTCPPPPDFDLYKVQKTKSVPAATNKVDILFVIDSSGSMLPQLDKMGTRFPAFIAKLNERNLDWRICVTLTPKNNESGDLLKFSNSSPYIDKTTSNAETLFLNLIGNIVATGSDERGIYVINKFLDRYSERNCLRSDAALNTVIVSDEDERSTGGQDVLHQQYIPLESRDYPESVFATLKNVGLQNKIYTNHSIVILPNDSACLSAQRAEQASGRGAWAGLKYIELSDQTGGVKGNICASDYGAQLEFIGQRIGDALAAFPLECSPVDAKGVSVTSATEIIKSITPVQSLTAQIDGNKILFSPALAAGSIISVEYYCLKPK